MEGTWMVGNGDVRRCCEDPVKCRKGTDGGFCV